MHRQQHMRPKICKYQHLKADPCMGRDLDYSARPFPPI